MNLLENAKRAIEMGVQDFEMGSEGRLLSAVRNLYAGILLLFKEKLRQLSPPGSKEVLLFKYISVEKNAVGSIVFRGRGKQTVGFLEIKERFESLGISTHWDRMERIQHVRNDIEHCYPRVGNDVIRGFLANGFIIIRDFVTIELNLDPLELFGEITWQTLLNNKEVFEREKEKCLELMGKIDWKSTHLEQAMDKLRCENCGSELIFPENNESGYREVDIRCKSCGHKEQFDVYVPRALENHFEWENYLSYTDGGNPGLINCPSCCHESYILEENYCPICNSSAETECSRCGSQIIPSELDTDGLCGYCRHVMEKDD